jgi:hypothetical protein
MRSLIRILGKHEAVYTSEIITTENDLLIEDKDEREEDDSFDSQEFLHIHKSQPDLQQMIK